MKPLCIDLFCGLGGWAKGFLAKGYDVVGFDIVPFAYPGFFVMQDVQTLNGQQFRNARIIVASPPCEQFSRHQMPWTRRRNPPEPDLSLIQSAWRIAREAAVPIVLENVRMAQKWLGPARWHGGSYYLWGDVPPLMPEVIHQPKESMSSTWKAERAVIPFDLAYAVAEWYGHTT